jgi:RelE-like HigB toxin of type II HigAB toxin-antitoxin system
LEAIHAAARLEDLVVPPSNRLEILGGKLSAFYSIRINDQWRVIFRWTGNNAHRVSIVDYHQEQNRRWPKMNSRRHAGGNAQRGIPGRVRTFARSAREGHRNLTEPHSRNCPQSGRITADTALRLSLYFGNAPEFWANLQTHYDLKMAGRELTAAAWKRIRGHRTA